SSMSGTGWTCPAGGTSCNRSTALAPSTSYAPITLTVNVAANAAATVTNTVTVGGGGETNTANNTANDLTNIVQLAPDLTITKSHAGSFTQGQTGVYTITVTNSGAGSTSGTVTVPDPLPTRLRPSSMSGTGWTCPAGGTTC